MRIKPLATTKNTDLLETRMTISKEKDLNILNNELIILEKLFLENNIPTSMFFLKSILHRNHANCNKLVNVINKSFYYMKTKY